MQILEPAPASSSRRLGYDTILPLPPRLLAAIAVDYARSAPFEMLAVPGPGERGSIRVRLNATHDIWLIRWGAGSRTVMHDHGGSAGALYLVEGALVEGALVERRPGPSGRGRLVQHRLQTLDHRTMPATHVHEVVNESDAAAASIHVYSPPLTAMHHYESTADSAFRVMHREHVGLATLIANGTREGAND